MGMTPSGARTPGPREASPDDTERGRILLFTGVRYQRMDADERIDDAEAPVSRADDIWA